MSSRLRHRRSAVAHLALRRLVHRLFREYRLGGTLRTNENFKHVHRMAVALRADREGLLRIDVDPDALEVAILLSDLGKETKYLDRHEPRYGGVRNRVFLDHSRVSMREGDLLRRELGVDAAAWRRVLAGVIGHDGPSIPGSWWKLNYERELGKRYPNIHGRAGLIHCYLDRIDQGGIFRTSDGQLNGGLRKISFDLYSKPGPHQGNLGAVISEIFGPTRDGTRDQLDHLDEVEKPRWLGSLPLPSVVREMKKKFLESEKYFEHVVIGAGTDPAVRIVCDDGSIRDVGKLDEFWRTLATVNPKGRR